MTPAFLRPPFAHVHANLARSRSLHLAWLDMAGELQNNLGSTGCIAVLTDASGMVIGSCCDPAPTASVLAMISQVGVELAEHAAGTNAVGQVVLSGQAATVLGDEHYCAGLGELFATAMPVRSAGGALDGVLAILSEGRCFAFDAAVVAEIYAERIAQRVVSGSHLAHLVVRFHLHASQLDTDSVGMVSIDGTGKLIWQNRLASQLLCADLQADSPEPSGLACAFGAWFLQVFQQSGDKPVSFRLPNGLRVWGQAQRRQPGTRLRLVMLADRTSAAPIAQAASERDDVAGAVSASTSMHDQTLELVNRTLARCQGNVSEAARLLRISRGTVYRYLKTTRTSAAGDTAAS